MTKAKIIGLGGNLQEQNAVSYQVIVMRQCVVWFSPDVEAF